LFLKLWKSQGIKKNLQSGIHKLAQALEKNLKVAVITSYKEDVEQ
jgi:hypothetical protein